MESQFDWNDSGEVVYPTFAGIAVYDSGDDYIVIRQQGLLEGDSVIHIPHDKIASLIKALNGYLLEE